MIKLLTRIFIRTKDEKRRRKAEGTLCSAVGIVLNVILFCTKYFAGFISGSIAIMADAFNNLSDAGSSFITLVGFWFAGKKPDIEHPFGHGRFEYLSGLGVAVMIMLMGFELAKDSVYKIIYPKSVESGTMVVLILVVSVVIKIYMAIYNRNIGKKIASSAMMATSMDSLSDAASTMVVLIAIFISDASGVNVDGVCGLAVSLLILYAGYNVAKDTISPLLGQPPEPAFVESINDIVMSYEGVEGIHDLVVHDYGPGRVMISLHTEVPGDRNIFEIHDMIDSIEKELNEKLGCEAVIHMDPIEMDNEIIKQVKSEVNVVVKEISEEMSIHDFRMVTGVNQTNLIFDVLVPFSVKQTDDSIKGEIQQGLNKLNDKYNSIVHIDRDYTKR